MPITIPANNAVPFASSGLKNTVPVEPSEIAGRASMQEGFPEATMQPLASGGKPPAGRDFNGILYQLSSHQVFLNAGMLYKFDSALCTAIGGYEKGAVLLLDNELSSVQSTVDANTANPNSSMTGWQPYGGKLINDSQDTKYNKSGGEISGDATVTGNLAAGTVVVNGSSTTEISHDSVGGANRAVLTTTADRFYLDKPIFNGEWSSATNGYTTLPNGFIMQFGFLPYSSNVGDLPGTTTGEKVFNLIFPIPFPSGCLSINTTISLAELEVENDTWPQVYGVSATGATVVNQTPSPESSDQQPFLGIYWQAIGR